MKCAVAIVFALIGMAVANPVGLGYASPILVPSAVSVSSSHINHGYGKVVPIIQPVSVPVLRTVPIIKTHVLTAPLSIGYGGYGLGYGGLGWGKGAGLGYGGWGYGNLGHGGWGYGNLGHGGWGNGNLGYGGGWGWGKGGGLGWSGVGIGKGWH